MLTIMLAIVFWAPKARAQERADPIGLDPWREAALLATSLTALSLAPLISVDTTQGGKDDWFPGDNGVKSNFSLRADRLSDASLSMVVAAPVLLHFPLDGPSAERALVYGESLLVNLGLVQAIKYVVQRPRPFNHNHDGRVRAFADRRGEDSYLSFFSGHSSTTFTAAVAGSYLHALQSDSEAARAAVWGVHIALAAATANWRVRAGRHYYSDTLVGALAGTMIGLGVPLLHVRDPGAYRPTAAEWGAMAGGLVFGLAASQLMPLEDDPGAVAEKTVTRVRMMPMTVPGAAGLILAASL